MFTYVTDLSYLNHRLEALRKEGRVGRTKLAGILRRLASVAREIEDVEDGEAVSSNDSSSTFIV